MTIIVFWILFLAALLGGLTMVIQPKVPARVFRLLLAFSGGYLLSTTLLHLLPELFVSTVQPLHIGGYLLVGFFLQCFIEMFSTGVEHGHALALVPEHCCIKPHKMVPFLACIVLHALLDGTLLVHDHAHHCSDLKAGLLIGMLLHKFLEAFTLMSVLRGLIDSLYYNVLCLVAFSLASPIGWLMSRYACQYFTSYGSIVLLTIVTGNFLYISATILFEASPGHCSNRSALWISLLGAGLAASIEFLGHYG